MKYTMTSPCDNCPFVEANGFVLRPGRVQEVRDHAGGGFPCHKTVHYSRDDEGGRGDMSKEVHCAGSLILQWSEWQGFDGLVAFAASLGMFDPHALPTPEQVGVFKTWDDMIDAVER